MIENVCVYVVARVVVGVWGVCVCVCVCGCEVEMWW